MTLPPPQPAADEVKASFMSADRVDSEVFALNTLTPTPSLDRHQKPKSLSFSNGGFLSAPLTGPVRPLSPDTISNLSIDEYEQIRPGRPSRQLDGDGRRISDSPAPPRGFKGKLQSFWIRNKGLAFMLLGQVFGTLMNVTTRLLEIEGNKGKGMDPANVRHG